MTRNPRQTSATGRGQDSRPSAQVTNRMRQVSRHSASVARREAPGLETFDRQQKAPGHETLGRRPIRNRERSGLETFSISRQQDAPGIETIGERRQKGGARNRDIRPSTEGARTRDPRQTSYPQQGEARTRDLQHKSPTGSARIRNIRQASPTRRRQDSRHSGSVANREPP